jgi:putative phage-type endonuclease
MEQRNMQQRSDEWFEARKGRVTASLVGAILGLSPYMSRADAMRVMVREALGAEREFTGNIATDYGTRNEAGALLDYRIETTHEVQEVGFVPFEDWAGCSPDAFVGSDGMIEIKCPYGLREATAPVPFKRLAEQEHYAAQVQFQLYVTGRKWCHFFQWSPNGTKLEVAFPDTDWQAANIPVLRQFHAEFLHEVANNAAEHLAAKRVEIDTPEAHKMAAEWDELREQIANAQERQRDLLDAIVSLAGGKDALFAGRKLTCVERSGSVQWAKVAAKYCPDADTAPFTGKPSRFWRLG